MPFEIDAFESFTSTVFPTMETEACHANIIRMYVQHAKARTIIKPLVNSQIRHQMALNYNRQTDVRKTHKPPTRPLRAY